MGNLWSAELGHSPLDVVAWHGNYAPYKYDLRRFNAIGSISYDHPDPSIFLVLQSPSDTPGVDMIDFVIFPPRWLVMEHTFRPPWFHRNVASEFMGLVHGVYDAKAEGFVPGGASLHNCMTGHGPDADTFAKASTRRRLEARPRRRHDGVHVRDAPRDPADEVRARSLAAAARLLHVLAGAREAFRPDAALSAARPMSTLNETHDAALRSWVESANAAGTDFPIQNLPFGVFRREGIERGVPRRGRDRRPDPVTSPLRTGPAPSPATRRLPPRTAPAAALNAFMAMGPTAWSALRLALSRALRAGSTQTERLRACLVPQAQAEYAVPAAIGDYTDFYTSIHHATNVGKLFRPDNPLLPNYKWVPIGYHGRGSSIGVSGQSFPPSAGPDDAARGRADRCSVRASGSTTSSRSGSTSASATRSDSPIAIADAERHVFGLCLLNDWSARDIQAWEYQPLGPFLAKSFATTVSPWIVTLEALAPYRVEWSRRGRRSAAAALSRRPRDARAAAPSTSGSRCWLETAQMRASGAAAVGSRIRP